MMNSVIESSLNENIFLDNSKYFFTFLADRFEHLNDIWIKALEKRFGGKFNPIYILSAKQNKLFPKENYLVINEKLVEIKKKLSKNNVIYLQDYEDLNKEFSESNEIKELIEKLVKKQGSVFILGFTSAFLNIKNPNIIVLGPNPELTTKLDDKIEHIKLFNALDVPRNKTRVYSSIKDIKINEKYPFYISAAYTSGGHESGTIYTEEDLDAFHSKLRQINKSKPFLVADLITNIKLSPNVNAIVCEKNDTRVICITDQILRGNHYLGNIYPSAADDNKKDEIINVTKKIGNYLSNLGFRGLFGLDFIIDSNEKLYTIDLNPRKQGGYLCNVLMSKKVNIPEMELKLALGEKVPNFDYSDFQVNYAWAHSKIKPYFQNTRITNCFKEGECFTPFEKKAEYKAIFYPIKHLLIDGNAGYIIISGDYDEVKEKIIKEAEIIVSKNFELYEGL